MRRDIVALVIVTRLDAETPQGKVVVKMLVGLAATVHGAQIRAGAG